MRRASASQGCVLEEERGVLEHCFLSSAFPAFLGIPLGDYVYTENTSKTFSALSSETK